MSIITAATTIEETYRDGLEEEGKEEEEEEKREMFEQMKI